MALITRGSISVWGWGGGGLVHVQHDPGPFFWYQNNFIFWCYFQNCLLIIIIILCAGILTRKKISITHTSSESCYQEGKKAFRSLSQNLIHQHEKDRTAAKNNNRMVCNPFIQLNTGTDTQGMHTAITFLTISLPTLVIFDSILNILCTYIFLFVASLIQSQYWIY